MHQRYVGSTAVGSTCSGIVEIILSGKGIAMLVMRVYVGRLLILIAPLVLGVLEVIHTLIQGSSGAFQVLHLDVGWWIVLQLLQIAVAVLLFLMVSRAIAGRNGPSVTISWIGMSIFLLFSLAYYGVVGIGTAILLLRATGLAEASRICLGPQSSAIEAIAAYYGSPIGTALLVTASLAWILGAVAAMRQRDRSMFKPTITQAAWK